MGGHQGDWVEHLQHCAFALNSTVHAGTQHTPHYAVFLRHPVIPLDHALRDLQFERNQSAAELLRARARVDGEVRSHIEAANAYAARYANRSRRPLELKPGDLVLLSTRNLPLPSTLSRKLAPTRLGPLRVEKVISPVAFRLELPPNLHRLHPVFHASLLTPYVGEPPPVKDPIFAAGDGDDEFEVERITAHRSVRGRT